MNEQKTDNLNKAIVSNQNFVINKVKILSQDCLKDSTIIYFEFFHKEQKFVLGVIFYFNQTYKFGFLTHVLSDEKTCPLCNLRTFTCTEFSASKKFIIYEQIKIHPSIRLRLLKFFRYKIIN